MGRNSKRISNKKQNITLEEQEVLTLDKSNAKNQNKRRSKEIDASLDKNNSNSPRSKLPKLVTKSTDKNAKSTVSDQENTNENASRSTNSIEQDKRVEDSRQVILNDGDRSSSSQETLDVEIQVNPNDDRFRIEEENQTVNKDKRSRPRAGNTPRSAKKSRTDEAQMNQNLSEQMAKLVKELAEVKEQLREKEHRVPAAAAERPQAAGKSGNSIHKSASTTTIYAPAVKLVSDQANTGVVANRINSKPNSKNASPNNISPFNKTVTNDKDVNNTRFIETCVTKFLNQIRLGNEDRSNRGAHRRLDFSDSTIGGERESDEDRNRRLARERILEAEKYKANIEIPKGKSDFCDQVETAHRISDDDDEFLHLTCHVDAAVIEKVETKQFVELDPFYPKNDSSHYRDDNRLDMVNRAGQVYWVPHVDRRQKIYNLHTWDQAFRVYMAIYTKKFPNEAAEMAQYVHTIHHAAEKYTWQNVAYYDYTFRKNMAKHPNRSWAKTFVHMWNIALCDPINRQHGSQAAAVGKGGLGNSGKKPCWRFNKGNCPYGNNCKFLHRCTGCGSSSHGANACPKKNDRKGKKDSVAAGAAGNSAATAEDTA